MFTLTKYLKFAAIWAAIISLCVGGTFLANHVADEKNQKFEDISGFFLHYESGGSGYYNDDTGECGDFFKTLEQVFFADGKITETDRQRDTKDEELIEFFFGTWNTRYMAAMINLQEGYLVSDTGKVYSMSDEFCQMVIAWQKNKEEASDTGRIHPISGKGGGN